jgi:hypothetical protein
VWSLGLAVCSGLLVPSLMLATGALVQALNDGVDYTAPHALFEHFASAAHDYAAASGAITVLVSHRFSPVRTADPDPGERRWPDRRVRQPHAAHPSQRPVRRAVGLQADAYR